MHSIPFQFAVSDYHRHTEVLVSDFVQSGGRRIIGIGGDGTLNEIVNGIFITLSTAEARQCLISLFPVGTGNDWVKSQRTELNLNNLLGCIKACQKELHAVGTVTLNSKKRYFMNVAGAGIDGNVVHEIENTNAANAKGKLSYIRGLLKGIRNYKESRSVLFLNDEHWLEKPILLAAASIGKYFGGGMKISPEASCHAKSIAFTIVEKVPNWKLFPQIYKLFTGQIGSVPFVHKKQNETLAITSDRPLPVQADGEFVGEARDIRFGLIPKGIHVLC